MSATIARPTIEELRSGGRGGGVTSVRDRAVAKLAAASMPVGAVVLALLAHWYLPNRQSALPTRSYPLSLLLLLGAAVVMVGLRWSPGRLGAWARYRGPLFAGAVVGLMTWDAVTLKLAWLPLPYFPGPDRVLGAVWEDRELLAASALHSLRLLMSGYALGVAAGLVCGVLIGWSGLVRYWAMPALKAIGPIPATAYVPLAMALFSSAFFSASALIAVAVWFPMTMLTSSGVANVPVSYLDVARTLGAGRWHLIFRVALPAALPSIFLGLFMGLGSAFLTLIVAETLGVSSGLGWYLKWKQGYLEYAHVYGAIVIMSLFFSGIMSALFKVRDRVLGWQKGVLRW